MKHDLITDIHLIFDTGVLILIWLVQLVIYPGLAAMKDQQLQAWHPVYTCRVTIVVLPLMMGQLIISILHVMISGKTTAMLSLLIVIIMWGITFGKAVPLHNQVETSGSPTSIIAQLIRVNWYRTIGWTIAWFISIMAWINALK